MITKKLYYTKNRSKFGWYSRGFLPHFDNGTNYQFITIRLADSIPAHVLRDSILQNNKNQYRLHEKYLDSLHGNLELKREDIARIVYNSIFFADGKKYKVIRWVIMPNHIHLLLKPINNYPICDAVRSFKSFSAREANKRLGKSGDFWARDYFDRYIRDEDHFRICIKYIDNNPVKSKLVGEAKQWKWGSVGMSPPGPSA